MENLEESIVLFYVSLKKFFTEKTYTLRCCRWGYLELWWITHFTGNETQARSSRLLQTKIGFFYSAFNKVSRNQPSKCNSYPEGFGRLTGRHCHEVGRERGLRKFLNVWFFIYLKVILKATYILWLLKFHYNQAQYNIYQVQLRPLNYYSIFEYIHQHGTWSSCF